MASRLSRDPFRWALAFALVGLLVGVPRHTNGATRIRLKGTTRIEAHAGRSSGELALTGSVADDAGRPVATRVGLALSPGSERADLPLDPMLPESCTNHAPASRLVLESATRVIVPTDESGRFCVRLLLPRDRYLAKLIVEGTDLLDESRLDLPMDARVKPLSLAIASPGGKPLLVPSWAVVLDADSIAVDVLATTDADGIASPVAALLVDLSNESGVRLGEQTTDGAGRAQFALPVQRIGPVGRGELRATFSGSAEFGAGSTASPIERRTRVRIRVPAAVDGVLPATASGYTFALRVIAEPVCAAHGCKSRPTGIVEARLGDDVVGAGTLSEGQARIPITLEVPHSARVSLSLRYIGDAPWFLAAEPTEVMQPVSAPVPWGRVVTTFAGVAVLAWFFAIRLPYVRRAPRSPPVRPDGGMAVAAGVHVVDASPDVPQWKGRVVDAHDGRAIAGAEIVVERAGFDGVRMVCQATADETGAFTMHLPDPRNDGAPESAVLELVRGSTLTATSPLHTAIRRPAPPFGTVTISMVLRRRELLERLVAWARKRGGGFDAPPEPTPALVRQAAGADESVARWANATERAAFGQDRVDAAAQSAVDGLAPHDGIVDSDIVGGAGTPESQSRPR